MQRPTQAQTTLKDSFCLATQHPHGAKISLIIANPAAVLASDGDQARYFPRASEPMNGAETHPALVLLVDILRQVAAVRILHCDRQMVLRQKHLPQLDDVGMHAAHALVLRAQQDTGRSVQTPSQQACHVHAVQIAGAVARPSDTG